MENTKIGWADHTMNWWIGCTKLSPGCFNCYAARQESDRFRRVGWGKGEPRHRTSAIYWRQPFKWAKDAARQGVRLRVFSMSLGDYFDPEVPGSWRTEAWDVIRNTPHLDWLILTKRPRQISSMLPRDWGAGWDNVWLGTSVEDMTRARVRIPALLKLSAKRKFLSCEPLLGPLDLRPWLRDIDWVIAGGESGVGWRPMEPLWAYTLRDQCAMSGSAFFMKQMAQRAGGAWAIPRDLNIQTFPA